MTLWYRFQETLWSEARVMLTMSSFPVIRTTPAGVWIDIFGHERFVLAGARKRYACPTVEEALASYRARKTRQARILRHQLARVEAALTLTKPGESTYIDDSLMAGFGA